MPMRLDKWLWAARFFKTRSLATDAVSGGKVHTGGERAKPGRAVKAGDRLEIRLGEDLVEVEVLELSEQRGPAVVAQALYRETELSQSRRRARAESRLLQPRSPRPANRPDKRERRRLIRVRKG